MCNFQRHAWGEIALWGRLAKQHKLQWASDRNCREGGCVFQMWLWSADMGFMSYLTWMKEHNSWTRYGFELKTAWLLFKKQKVLLVFVIFASLKLLAMEKSTFSSMYDFWPVIWNVWKETSQLHIAKLNYLHYLQCYTLLAWSHPNICHIMRVSISMHIS